MNEESRPWWVFKNLNSLTDMDCYIEGDLPEISPIEVITSQKVKGRSGRLHRSYGDYDSYEYPIEFTIGEHDRLEEVKRWLRGQGKLVTYNDPDKYRIATVTNVGKPIEYENEMGFFWKSKVTFECEPFRRKLTERPIPVKAGENEIVNHGTEISKPQITFDSGGGDISIFWNGNEFKLLNTPKGRIIVDSETGLVYCDGVLIKNKGERPLSVPGKNTIELVGKWSNAEQLLRSVWL